MQAATEVRIANGTYRNINVKDVVFPLVKDYKQGKTGNFITVDGSTVFLDSETLMVEDKNIVLGKVSDPTDTTCLLYTSPSPRDQA